MDLGLKDKVVLCMASAAGLGKGIATEMAREGAKVMICTAEPFKDQLLEAQAEIEKETGNRPETFLCDVNKPEDIDALVKHTVDTLGDIYALVICARVRSRDRSRTLMTQHGQALSICVSFPM